MLSSIIDGICIKINYDFEDVDIHTEPVEQGFMTPCFVITNEKAEYKRLIGNRYEYLSTFKVMYYPDSDEPNKECLEMSEFLHDNLEFISINTDITRGANFVSEIKDNVLTFKCDYNITVYKTEDVEPMDKLTQTLEYSREENKKNGKTN